MAKRSFKAGKWHHTSTNARNVARNRGWKYHWGKYHRKKKKNKRLKANRRAKRIITDFLLFFLFLSILIGVFWLGK